MKKTFKFYAIIWALLLALFNLVVFLTPALPMFSKNYDPRFWISWGCVIAAYLGQLVCAYMAFKGDKEKLFLSIPIIRQSYATTVLATAFGVICILIPNCPAWFAAIVCGAVTVFSLVATVKAKAAGDAVTETDQKIKVQTFFIKSLAADAETLVEKAGTDEVKEEIKKLAEAIRYSDPMSSEALAGVESQITVAFAKLTEAVNRGEWNSVAELAKDVVLLVNDRNRKCRLLK